MAQAPAVDDPPAIEYLLARPRHTGDPATMTECVGIFSTTLLRNTTLKIVHAVFFFQPPELNGWAL